MLSIACQFSQCVAPFLYLMASISKPELYDWRLCLVSEDVAVFTPLIVVRITITASFYPRCALASICWRSIPIRHLWFVTWHPPSKQSISEQTRVMTLIIDKLFTVWGDFGETRQLRQTRSGIMNVTWVTPRRIIAINQCSVLAVVTDNCHANSILVSHITSDVKRR